MHARWTTAAGLACLATSALIGLGVGGQPAAAAEQKEVLELVALTGPAGGDVTITVPADVEELEHVNIRLAGPGDEGTSRVVNLDAVEAEDGDANVELGELPRGTRLDVQVHIRETKPPRTRILRGEAVAKLRPDLVVAAVHAPAQTLTTRTFDVSADVNELNQETGAEARLTLMLGPSPVSDPETVAVGPGGEATALFEDVRLEQASTAELTVRVEDADPFETDTANNARTHTIEVTEHELARSTVLLDALGGFGAQFNQHVYAAITPKPLGSLPDLEAKVRALEPHLVRIFFHEVQERDPDQLASFYKTVELAQSAGATVNITYHTATNAKLDPPRFMRTFADVLENLVRTRGLTGVRWVTIQNEPNSTSVTLDQYERLHRALDTELRARGLRSHIGLMGGDLVENGPASAPVPNHIPWWRYMAEEMNDVLDAYSVHIYWNYWDLPRMQFRLRNVYEIVNGPLLEGARKPIFVTEFGVRGIQNITGLPAIQPGYWQDGTPLSRTNIAAFQHFWFDIAASQLGYSGTVKWDAYWGRYTLGYRETYNLIGPAEEGWPLFPAYHALNLLFQTTERGWQVVRVLPWEDDDWRDDVADPAEKELAAFVGPDGQLTMLGLDSAGRGLNSASSDVRSYSIGGLAPGTELTLALWNAAGDGQISVAGTVTANAAGVVRFEVPLQAAFSLTTVPVS